MLRYTYIAYLAFPEVSWNRDSTEITTGLIRKLPRFTATFNNHDSLLLHAQHWYHLLVWKVANKIQESLNSKEYHQKEGIKWEK